MLVYFLFVGIDIHCRYYAFYYLHCYRLGSDGQYKYTIISDELLSNLKSTKQKEMYQEVTKPEQLLDSDPHPLVLIL